MIGSSLEDRILELLRQFLAAQVSFDEFESRFCRLYPDAEMYPVVSDACDSLFSEVLERLSWASEKVSPVWCWQLLRIDAIPGPGPYSRARGVELGSQEL